MNQDAAQGAPITSPLPQLTSSVTLEGSVSWSVKQNEEHNKAPEGGCAGPSTGPSKGAHRGRGGSTTPGCSLQTPQARTVPVLQSSPCEACNSVAFSESRRLCDRHCCTFRSILITPEETHSLAITLTTLPTQMQAAITIFCLWIFLFCRFHIKGLGCGSEVEACFARGWPWVQPPA